MIKIKKDKLDIKCYDTRAQMGAAAGKDISACIRQLLEEKEYINMIFAAAPSQNEVLEYLVGDDTICWQRINAFHMDEYVGIDAGAPQAFSNFLKKAIFDKVPFRSVNTIDCTADPKQEAARYSELLRNYPTDIVCMGIGENGHIAFNDPHVADFNDPEDVKIVSLDDVCRMQQVHDGCFPDIDSVPKYALTLTVPLLARATYHFCVVPAATKANAVRNTVYGKVGEACPATVLRITDNSTLYCDADSAKSVFDNEKLKKNTTFRLGVITDEVSADIKEACEFAAFHNLDCIEIRSVNNRGPFEYTDDDITEIKAAAGKHNLAISCISSPLFKCKFDDIEARKKHVASFEKLAENASRLGVHLIRGFDFFEAGISLAKRAAAFLPIIDICEKYDITLVIENDPSVHSDTPDKVAELVKEINNPRVLLLYDPGNVLFVSESIKPYPDCYEKSLPYVAHIHIKDAIFTNPVTAVCIGEGEMDYKGLFTRLVKDGYKGDVILETHYRKNMELSEEQLVFPGGRGFSQGAYPASEESIISLKDIILSVI